MFVLQPHVAAEQLADRQAAAAASRAAHRAGREIHAVAAPPAAREGILMRRASLKDTAALVQLARLDSARVPAGELLVAEVAGQIVAAVALDDGTAIADPFRRTEGVVELLRMRARLLDGGGGARVAKLRARLPHLRTAA